MAPPIPGLSRPPAMPRRPAGDVLAGILAVLALLALTAGVPLGLITVFGLPIPQSMPTMSVLTHQLDIHAVLQVLMVVVWLAWLQLLCCVFAEVRAAVRNAGMPARVPLAGGTQAVAHRLVTAALVLFTTTPRRGRQQSRPPSCPGRLPRSCRHRPPLSLRSSATTPGPAPRRSTW
jgi:hypothetical protein